MDDFNNPVFAQTKIEYTKQLTDVLTLPMYEGLQSIYEETKQDYANNTDISIHILFRKRIENVPKWNTDMIEDEVDRIMRASNCDWLDDLITAVFISHTRVLASIGSNRTKKINLTIPKITNFIHKCYINTARELWKNPYLFDENVSSGEYQKNIKYIEELIKENVEHTIRKLLPVKNILREHLDNNDISEDIIKKEEDNKQKNVQKMLMDELIELRQKDRERFTLNEEDEKYFDDHVNEQMIQDNTKNIKINDIINDTNNYEIVEHSYDNANIVEPSVDESVVSIDEKLNDYRNIIEENKANAIIAPIIEEPKIEEPKIDIVEPVKEQVVEPEPLPEEHVITPSDNLISDDINNIKTTSDIENIIEDDTIKKIQTSNASIDSAIQQEGKGKVETIKEDDTITLDNFMDDMSNMLKDKDVEVKNEKGEYTLFDDANDVG